MTKIHRQNSESSTKMENFGLSLATRKVLDARCRGVTTEAYEQYAAGRSDRRQRRPSDLLRAVSGTT
ncbi:MAG: hypothetical protein JRC68_02415 [Deltaproteobacteria bacterium]|nr:hypothetical protein [Deltaproteobacteria bacterium]